MLTHFLNTAKTVNLQNLKNCLVQSTKGGFQTKLTKHTGKVQSNFPTNFVTLKSHFHTQINKIEQKTDLTWLKLSNRGEALLGKGEYLQAKEIFLKALLLSQQNCNTAQELETFNRLAVIDYAMLEDFQSASNYCDKWSKLSHFLKDYDSLSDSLSILIFSLARVGEKEKLKKALLDFETILIDQQKDQVFKRLMTHKLGSLYRSLGDYEKGLKYFQKAQEMLEKHNENVNGKENEKTQEQIGQEKLNEEQEIELLEEVYRSNLKLSQIEIAIVNGKKLVKKLLSKNKNIKSLRTLMDLAYFAKILKKHTDAIELYSEASTLAEKTGSVNELIAIQIVLGELYSLTKNFEQSKERLESSIKICTEHNKYQELVSSYEMYGNVLFNFQHWDEAINKLKETIDLSKKHNVQCSEGLALLNIGNSYNFLKNFDQAKDHYLKCLASLEESRNRVNKKWEQLISREVKSDERVETQKLINENAIDINGKKFQIAKRLETTISQFDMIQYKALLNLMNLLTKTSKYGEALEYGEQAIQLIEIAPVDHTCECDNDESRQEHTNVTKISVYNEMQKIAILSKDLKYAESIIKKNLSLLKLFQKIEYKHQEIDALNLLASVYMQQDKWKVACMYLEKAVHSSQEISDNISLVFSAYLNGKCLNKIGNFKSSEMFFELSNNTFMILNESELKQIKNLLNLKGSENDFNDKINYFKNLNKSLKVDDN
ncbi:rapsyn-related [Anaeramoeba flamelloides]|uniref:Tetratricopeptide repeat protein 29 n=1 Tax=Anaeramoeba flamelloides TaxID=1746091 RepID=A0ABQ8ZD40_9EUKA|nr:rapsyn-related [Anaeramoeba flamelloides]